MEEKYLVLYLEKLIESCNDSLNDNPDKENEIAYQNQKHILLTLKGCIESGWFNKDSVIMKELFGQNK